MHDGHPLGTGNKNSEFWIEWENIRWKNYPSNLKFKWKVQHHKEFNAVPFYAESLGIKKGENEKLEWVDFHHLPLFSFNSDMPPWEFVTWNICRGFLPSLLKIGHKTFPDFLYLRKIYLMVSQGCALACRSYQF